MKTGTSLIVTVVAALLIGGLFLWHHLNEKAHEPAMTTGDGASIYLHKESMKNQRAATNSPAAPPSSNQAPPNLGSNQ